MYFQVSGCTPSRHHFKDYASPKDWLFLCSNSENSYSKALFQSFSQIVSLISCQRTNSGKILEKIFHVFHKDLAYFCTIIGYYTRLPLDFNPYRKKPLQSPLQSHAISRNWGHLGRVWEDKGTDI